MTDQPPSSGPAKGVPVPLLKPHDGLPPVVDSAEALAAAVEAFTAGHGPVAVDAERASGYRYSHRAYLVQLRRAGSGTALIDPVRCPDLHDLDAALADTEWVLHAATQDLPCLAELGFRPRTLFDTELAGRLLSYPKVGLGALVEELLGFTLEKGHSAVDWSTRPLPEPWLVYAALDVELLVELRDVLAEALDSSGKREWATQEFAALVGHEPRETRRDPWRRTSGIHRIRNRRELAYVRSLWTARDETARRRDISPGRVLSDLAIITAASTKPTSRAQLAALGPFENRAARRDLDLWWSAVRRARELDDGDLPEHTMPYDGPPPARAWADRDPSAAARLSACRTSLHAIADRCELPVENLLAPDSVRRLAWDPPADPTSEAVARVLRERGARDWQVELTSGALAEALAAHLPDPA
ncbi:ribonuclease D [Actinopolymorpha cephalotaxi]|uniref:Ribonuclease D n=1 Tax=Actinopolymorpha cephalotaxi TaxID=504797 RepID=A0A1I2PQ97_9ACTN|nr:ribonuclease D [Actinopolymorpha cephalotaxi]NYH83547.1 ribonuclease D [Actinopolymorpha cephalotaxi]SFG17269.1 ribonuclease D [Actinopolymorpha cephalotaxi]